MERGEVEAAIRSAFAGVRLGSGMSLRQAQAADTWGDGHTEREWRALPRSEITDDWSAIPNDELERDCTAYLDAEGLRYYLPALMLWLLDHYDDEHRLFREGASLTLDGTIAALDQRDRHPDGFLELLTPQQRRAVAVYVKALPELVELDHEDAAAMARAWRDVWSLEVAPSL